MATKKKAKAKVKAKGKTKKTVSGKIKAKAKAKAKKASPTKKKKAVAKKPVATVATAAVKMGSRVPDVALPATGGKVVALGDLKGKHVILYFYPKDSTPGCTIEGHDFSRLYDSFKAAGAEVFGISRDTLASHEKFKTKENYCIDLLSDEKEVLSKMFGVIKMKNMYGKQVRGIERSTFVLDREGHLIKEWRGVQVNGHADEVLAFVKSL